MWWWFHKHHKHRHRHHIRVLFSVAVSDEPLFAIILEPGKRVHTMTKVTVGHKIALSISYLDANGNPLLTTPTPDSPPTWANTTPATETLVASADGLSANTTALAPGTDAVSLTVVVGGATFSASLSVEVDAVPQVLTSVAINAVVT
jgi:hypothetical protein